MNETKVKFLGKDYIFPKELKEYVLYCNIFDEMSTRLSNALLITMNRRSIIGENSSQAGDVESVLNEKMRQEGRTVIAMLAKKGIFDVTEDDVVERNSGFRYYHEVYTTMMDGLRLNLADEIESFLQGMDEAQKSAYSQVTGSGLSLISNSFIAHMTFAAMESNTVRKQCEKAEKEYDRAMSSLSARNASERERKNAAVMKKTYEGIVKSFGMFVSELMEFYLGKLQQKGVFDYSKVKPYNIKRSSDLLKNLTLVDNKKGVLEMAFQNCPYNPDIYVKLLELDLCDVDSFITAKEFYQDSLLVESVEEYCRKNYSNKNKVKAPIAVLALYKGKTELEINAFFESKMQEALKKQRQEKIRREKEKREAEEKRKNEIYNLAISKYSSNKISDVEEAKNQFGSIIGWENANEYYVKCDERIEELVEQKKIDEIKQQKTRKIYVISLIVVCIALGVHLLLIRPRLNYEKGIKALYEGDYKLAEELILSSHKSEELFDAYYSAAISLYEEKEYEKAYPLLKILLQHEEYDVQECYDAIEGLKIAIAHMDNGLLETEYLRLIEDENIYNRLDQKYQDIIDEMKQSLQEMQGYYSYAGHKNEYIWIDGFHFYCLMDDGKNNYSIYEALYKSHLKSWIIGGTHDPILGADENGLVSDIRLVNDESVLFRRCSSIPENLKAQIASNNEKK